MDFAIDTTKTRCPEPNHFKQKMNQPPKIPKL